MHAWTICIEDARDLDLEPVLAVVVKEQRLGAALALIVAGARTNGIDIAPVRFGLRMHGRAAIYFTRRCLEDAAFETLGKPQHVDRAMHRCLRRLHGVMLVVHGGSWAGQIVDFVYFDIERK